MFGLFKKKENFKIPLKVDPVTVGWRNHMWVMTPDGVGIIFRLGVISNVHLTDIKGETIASNEYHIHQIRQATYLEIPEARRQITKEAAASLGYN